MRTYKKYNKKSRTYKKYGGEKTKRGKGKKDKNGNVYFGETIDGGIKHGKGTMKYNRHSEDQDDIYLEYTGDWKDDMKHGYGEMDFYDTGLHEQDEYKKYSGNWVNDNINGLGKMIFVSGNVYEGWWKDQQMSGPGKMKYANTHPDSNSSEDAYAEDDYSNYDGEWLKGLKHGLGTMIFMNGDKYIGNWENDKMVGEGLLEYSDGNPNNYSTYRGDWDNNMREGYGELKFRDGRAYNGYWEGDEPLCDDWPQTHIEGEWGDTTWKCVDPDFREALLFDAGNLSDEDEDEDDDRRAVAFEIHLKSAKINLEKYVELIDMDKDNSKNYGDIVSYIKPKFEAFIREHFQPNEQQLSLLKLNAVLDKFSSAREISEKPGNIRLVGKTIDFVFSQPKEFIDFYIRAFIKDCYHAYPVDDENELNEDGMSCVGGILERFYMIVGDSAYALCPGYDCDNPKYVELLDFFRKRLDRNELTMLWANTHLENPEFEKLSPEKIKQHYIEFMQNMYKENDLFDEITEKMINDEADKLEESGMFERMRLGVLGGKRRKTNKRSKKNKPLKTRKTKK